MPLQPSHLVSSTNLNEHQDLDALINTILDHFSFQHLALSDFFYPPFTTITYEDKNIFTLVFQAVKPWETIVKDLIAHVIWVPIAVHIHASERRLTESHFAEIRKIAAAPLTMDQAPTVFSAKVIPSQISHAIGTVDIAVPYPFLLCHTDTAPLITASPSYPVEIRFCRADRAAGELIPKHFHDIRMFPSVLDNIVLDGLVGNTETARVNIHFATIPSIYAALILGLAFDYLFRLAPAVSHYIVQRYERFMNSDSVPDSSPSVSTGFSPIPQ